MVAKPTFFVKSPPHTIRPFVLHVGLEKDASTDMKLKLYVDRSPRLLGVKIDSIRVELGQSSDTRSIYENNDEEQMIDNFINELRQLFIAMQSANLQFVKNHLRSPTSQNRTGFKTAFDALETWCWRLDYPGDDVLKPVLVMGRLFLELTRVPQSASVMSSTRRTETPARYISTRASSTLVVSVKLRTFDFPA